MKKFPDKNREWAKYDCTEGEASNRSMASTLIIETGLQTFLIPSNNPSHLSWNSKPDSLEFNKIFLIVEN